MTILEVNGLKKIYSTRFGGNKVEALKNVNFSCNYSEPHSQNRIFDASILLMWVTSPYKIAILSECKHSQKAILHGSE